MKLLIKFILFLFVFAIEIRVKAAEFHQEPQGCLEEFSTECLVFTSFKGAHISLDFTHDFYLGGNTLLFRDISGEWSLIRGIVRLNSLVESKKESEKNKSQLLIKTVLGSFESSNSDFILTHNKEDLMTRVFVVSGKVKIMMKSPQIPFYQLPEGTTNWYGAINSKGYNDEGIPQPLVWKDIVRYVGFDNWYLVLSNKKEIKEGESENIDSISLFYKQLVSEINSLHANRILAEEQSIKAKEEEAQRVRALFRKKVQLQIEDDL